MALTPKKVYAILKKQISEMEAKLNSPVRYKGTVASADLLPLNPSVGDMYNIESKSIYGEAGMNVAWNGVTWDTMGAPIDMSLYIKQDEIAEWAKQQNKPTYTADEVGALPVGTKIPSKTSELQNDSGFLAKVPDGYLNGTDVTLKESGKAADAKATGDKFTEVSADISKKLDKNQGSENSGKIAGINEAGDIVPMNPVGVDYNEETNCLEFGSDQKMELNKGINLDATLTKTGYAADAGVVGEITNSLKEDLGDIKPISTGDTTFVEAIYNHIKGLEDAAEGYWGDQSNSATLSKMQFKTAPGDKVFAVKPIELKAGITYNTTNARVYLCYLYDKVTKIYTRYYQVTTWKEKVAEMTIKPENDSVLYMTIPATNYEKAMVVNGEIPTDYYTYGKPIGDSVNIPNLSIKKHNIVTVKKDGSGDFTKIYEAVNSIQDANKKNIYDIHIYPGTYDVIDEVFGSGDYYKTEGIVLPPYVNLIGIGQRDSIILKAEFPNSVSTEVSTEFSTINVDGSNNLENLTFIAYNCRYACHDDDGNAEKSRNFMRNVKNCRFWHKGCYTDDGSVWKWCKAYAQGLSSGSVSNFEYCEFQTDVNIKGNCAWSSHGRKDMEKPSYITHRHCKFINTNFDLCASTNGLNDHVEEFVKYIGCEFTRSEGTGNNIEINKEKYESDGVYFNAYGIGNKNCYEGTGIYASGAGDKLHFFANDN